mgnify:FL=1
MVTMNIETFNTTIRSMKNMGFNPDAQCASVRIPNAKQNIEIGLKRFVQSPKWLPEYDAVSEWLSDNHGRGLLCIGNLGRGKTIICAKILPVLLNYYHRLIVHVVDATELNTKFEDIKQYHILCIDDVGVENEAVKYGERKILFTELVDLAEKKGKLLLLTTNLSTAELSAKYGMRTLDRLKAITRVVHFKGESLRK